MDSAGGKKNGEEKESKLSDVYVAAQNTICDSEIGPVQILLKAQTNVLSVLTNVLF